MYKYSKISERRMQTCHPDLQLILNVLIEIYDITIICGYRDKQSQMESYLKGNSKVKYPNSKHNYHPSMAVDIVPYPRLFKAPKYEFFYLAGLMKGIVGILKLDGKITHDIRWGGDWDSDNNFEDQAFNDLAHFELVAN